MMANEYMHIPAVKGLTKVRVVLDPHSKERVTTITSQKGLKPKNRPFQAHFI